MSDWNEIATLLHCAEKLQGHPNYKSLLDLVGLELQARTDAAAEELEEKRAAKVEAQRVADEEAAAERARLEKEALDQEERDRIASETGHPAVRRPLVPPPPPPPPRPDLIPEPERRV